MKWRSILVVLGALAAAINFAAAQQRSFGLGIVLGEPAGISAKLWTSDTHALEFGLGWSAGPNYIYLGNGIYGTANRIHFHMDYLWHSFDAIHSNENFPLYYGVGGMLDNGGRFDNIVAVRGVFGIEWIPRQTPLDVFLEVAPFVPITIPSSLGVDLGIGARFYFP